MGIRLEDIAIEAVALLVGDEEINKFIINRLVKAARNRPHPWTTRHDYISWTGLTDRTFSARLLRANPYPKNEATGTRRPPLKQVAALFRTKDGRQRPCPKSTLLFPAFAQYLTDGFLRTEMQNKPPWGTGQEDRRRTTSNHEIDQSPLYGRTPAQTAVLRVSGEGAKQKGRLKSQIIEGEEYSPFLLGDDGKVKREFCDATGNPVLDNPLGIDRFPPGTPRLAKLFAVGGDRVNSVPQVAMLNTLWLREHNRLAAMFVEQHPGWDNDRVFETARNVVIVMFIKIVVQEYINHINTSVFRFRADPRVAWHADWNRPNWMTAEFALLYRWHSLVPQKATWAGIEKDGGELLLNNQPLLDHGLAAAFADVSANPATELGLGNTASFLLDAEERAVAQGRLNNVTTFNDYRVAMGLDPLGSFAELVGKSDDADESRRRKDLAAELKRLYGVIDNLEFYVGLFAEPREANGPLPELVMIMVAVDAFSQALTNPLLSEHIYGNPDNRELAFTTAGLEEIAKTRELRDVLVRNASGLGRRFVGMTRRDWRRD